MKCDSQTTPRKLSIASLAIVLVAMQWFAHIHRIVHAPHTTVAAPELWLQIANGVEVSAETWADSEASASKHSFDPWSHHQSSVDCATFDALCAGDTPMLWLAVTQLPASVAASFTRIAVARVDARLLRPRARAPPFA